MILSQVFLMTHPRYLPCFLRPFLFPTVVELEESSEVGELEEILDSSAEGIFIKSSDESSNSTISTSSASSEPSDWVANGRQVDSVKGKRGWKLVEFWTAVGRGWIVVDCGRRRLFSLIVWIRFDRFWRPVNEIWLVGERVGVWWYGWLWFDTVIGWLKSFSNAAGDRTFSFGLIFGLRPGARFWLAVGYGTVRGEFDRSEFVELVEPGLLVMPRSATLHRFAFTWAFNPCFWRNFLLHIEHSYGISPVWIFKWTFKVDFWENPRLQISH